MADVVEALEKQYWDWLVESLHYFRRMGFLSHLNGIPDGEAAAAIITQERERCQRESCEPFWVPLDKEPLPEKTLNGDDWDDAMVWFHRPRPDQRDLLLLRDDVQRLWWEDGEGDIDPNDGTYVRIIQAWSRISRGAFLPTDVQEVWDRAEQWPESHVTIHLKLADKDCTLQPWDAFGWIDFGILNGINDLMRGSGLAFEMWDTGDQMTCLLVLSTEEKRWLTEERGWEFADIATWGDTAR